MQEDGIGLSCEYYDATYNYLSASFHKYTNVDYS